MYALPRQSPNNLNQVPHALTERSMKRLLVIACLAGLIDLGIGDPMRLRHPNLAGVKQVVHNTVDFLVRGEYQQVLQSQMPHARRQ